MKYIKLYIAFFKASLTADLEFRANFITRIITDIFWYLAQIISFEIIYSYTGAIGDWTHNQMRFFLGVLFVVDSTYMVVFSMGLDFFSESVRKGNLDLLLTKPINSQFMMSCQRASTANVGNLILGFSWLIWSLLQLENASWARALWLALLLPSGVIIMYSMRFFFSMAALVFQKAESVSYLWYHIYKLGMRPDNIYFPWLKILILSVFPVGMIAGVPSRVVLGTANPFLAIACVLMASILLYVSNLSWKWSLKQYASASS